MGEREYKQLSCRDMGHDCDFLVRAETENELLHLANEHLCEVHDICAITPNLKDQMSNSMKNVWCQEGHCSYTPKEMEFPHYG
jgi:predicted small metal-binding protein